MKVNFSRKTTGPGLAAVILLICLIILISSKAEPGETIPSDPVLTCGSVKLSNPQGGLDNGFWVVRTAKLQESLVR